MASPTSSTASRSRAVALGTVYASVTLYSLCFMAQVPLLPYILQELRASSLTYGTLQTTFSFAQLVGGLLSGPLVDKWGGRALLLLSLWTSVLSYALTATARSLLWLYLSRLPTVMQHAILAARALVAANAPADQRARLMGYLGTAYGVGFALGPALGGVLSAMSGSLRAGAWVAAAASLLAAVAVHFLVPVDCCDLSPAGSSGTSSGEQDGVAANGKQQDPAADRGDAKDASSKVQNGSEQQHQQQKQRTSLLQSVKVLQYAGVRQVMSVKAVTGLAGALLQSVFSLMLQQQYGLSSQRNGMVLSYVGVLTLVSQALLVEPVRLRLGEGAAVYWGCVVLALSYLGMAASQRSLAGLLAALAATSAAGSVLTTISTAQLTQAAPPHVMGSVLALDMSLFSGVRLFTPALGTLLLRQGGAAAVGLVAGSLLLVLLLAINLGLVRCSVGAEAASVQVASTSLDKDAQPSEDAQPDAGLKPKTE